MDDITKKYKRDYIIFRILSIFVLTAPILIACVWAFQAGEVEEKLVLGITITVALVLVLANALMKYNIRSTLWILILGIHFCIDDMTPILLAVAIATILDEFILTPLEKKYKNLYTINNQIDKRSDK